jgi:hypothetical protein
VTVRGQHAQGTGLAPSGKGLIRAHGQFLAICGVAFILTRLYLLFVFEPHHSDISLYSQYAYEYLLASKQHESFYTLHERVIDSEIQASRGNHLAAPTEEKKIIPYPPLAIQMLRIPSLFVATEAAWDRQAYLRFAASYQSVFRTMLFLFDLLNFILIAAFLMRQASALSLPVKIAVGLGYVASVFFMPHTLYDRLDIVIGTLLLFSVVLLRLGKKWWSFVVFAGAVNYKISPIVLVPLIAAASIAVQSAGKGPEQSSGRFPWKGWLQRTAILCGCIAVLFAPFAFFFGKESLSAFQYQFERGLHVESVLSAIALSLSAVFGISNSVGFGFGSFMLSSPLSRPFAAASGPLTLFAMAAVYAVLHRWYCAQIRVLPHLETGRREEAHGVMVRRLLVDAPLLCLSALIVVSKNFSPQYLFWLLPLIFLMDFKRKDAIAAAMLYLCACVLSSAIFPGVYFSDIVGRFTGLGKTLLVVRAAVLTAFTGVMLLSFLRDLRAADRPPLAR